MKEERLYDVYALDEDIKILEEFIKNSKTEDPFTIYFKEECRAIEHLIEAYKQCVEDNKHQWEERCKVSIEYDDLLNNSIPKSKVKEILEKYKYTDTGETFKLVEFYKELKELLEEE